jgi:hypothetical protein
MRERAFLVYAIEKPITTMLSVGVTKDVTPLLVISDEGAIEDYDSFGWVPRTDQEV